MPKMTRWLGPNTTQRFKTPSGPLEDGMGTYAQDYSRQRSQVPSVMGSCRQGYRTMNSGGGPACKPLGSLPTADATAPLKNADR